MNKDVVLWTGAGQIGMAQLGAKIDEQLATTPTEELLKLDVLKYKNAGHGFGLGVGTDAEGWIEHAIRF